MNSIEDTKIAVVGLGYVGLPVAIEFGKQRKTIGFDIDSGRIEELCRFEDRTKEMTSAEMQTADKLTYSSNPADLADCNFFIVTVPTPVDTSKQPDLTSLDKASQTVGKWLSKGDIVVFESTVYPGVTEDFCAAILEQVSGLTLNEDFFVGYSPERINPGDLQRRLPDIIKITSGSTPEAAELVDAVYKTIIKAGTHLAPTIKVAEAAKVIENTQRDLNIALVNELSLIFERLDIRTSDVLDAAGTKWNFLPFKPGLVGGHCIGVDPYYLAHKAEMVGYHPEIILAGRRINSRMAAHAANKLIKAMIHNGMSIRDQRVLIMGLTFKENCPDVRNTKVIEVAQSLEEFGLNVDIHDPWVSEDSAKREFGIDLVTDPKEGCYDAVLLAVPHVLFLEDNGVSVEKYRCAGGVLMDLKSVLPREYGAVVL